MGSNAPTGGRRIGLGLWHRLPGFQRIDGRGPGGVRNRRIPHARGSFPPELSKCPVACEAVEESSFFHRQFDAVIASGLLFLLPLHVQEAVIHKVGQALNTPGRFLFTAPGVKADWVDILTGRDSTSPGAETYRAWLTASGLFLQAEFEDDGQNHYYDVVKTRSV